METTAKEASPTRSPSPVTDEASPTGSPSHVADRALWDEISVTTVEGIVQKPILQPRMLLTVDENLKPLSVPVRVGQAVDVVGQAGRPKTITGFQTHSTPVLLAAGDRAELATEKYIPLSPILEGFVILKENPDYTEDN
ncbi:hypothetical protein LWI29_037777 [Acer saccharum]|uniref:26S proteasome non-ATPase regulatory subunit RPN1 C-terminal domain-containing protein n=1 Tax=Acer saccharum TaxID=4024 RepID=A0AA39VWC0_ACESA|nr:hypothetical protein LWI29_037777 [Acer saccharum]